MPAPGDTRLLRRRPPRRASRVGSTLVGLGFLTILAVAFFGGMVAGRHFPRMLPSLGAVTVPKEPRRGTESRLADRTKVVEPAPVLTFYQELTAPLTSPPPASKPKPDRAKPAALARYTVQVGAFGQREQAEAIRARLAAAGHDAFVADLDAPAATRFRVRIGSYASRDEARRAAERLTATERLSTYVTLR
ncbi:MAG: hypothetical protein AUG80_14035 [Candidatus Rokubacteria bacterium 13_1_20CM_4_68_9]|nr:MAG: hypothetical protein AUG80_14035 [Candidatus Rokubacteria bacterium 13_1_20CM_4_68_9]